MSRSRHALSLCYIAVAVATLPCIAVVQAQEASFSASTTIFSEVAHTRRDGSSDTRLEGGIRGDVGAVVQSGAHNFNARYGIEIETQQSSLARDDDDQVSFYGSSRYNFFRPGGRFDANAGHSIRSVRNETGFAITPSDYRTQNALSAGTGITMYPGALTSFRVGGQAAHTWEEGDLEDGETATLSARLTRQVSERSQLFLDGGRSWEERGPTSLTLDNITTGLESRLENGTLSVTVGVSRAEDDDFENDAVIGSVNRTWTTDWSSTHLSAERSQTSTLLDLALSPIPELGIEDEFSIRMQGLHVRNSVGLTHTNQRFCDLCTVRLVLRGTQRENVQTDEKDYEYLAGTGLTIAMDTLQTLALDYRWQGDAFTDRTTIDDEVHRLFVTWRREVTELAAFGVTAGTDLTRGMDDRERHYVRLFFTLGLAGADYW